MEGQRIAGLFNSDYLPWRLQMLGVLPQLAQTLSGIINWANMLARAAFGRHNDNAAGLADDPTENLVTDDTPTATMPSIILGSVFSSTIVSVLSLYAVCDSVIGCRVFGLGR
jgi:hypothetical protein